MNEIQNFGFSNKITDTIRSRVSVRTYDKKPLSGDLMKKITEHLKKLNGPFEARCTFTILDKAEAKQEDNIKLGTYGVIKGASTYIAGVVENKPFCMEQLGYQMEWLILYLTEIGLGTCWLAGTFNRGSFTQAVECKSNELMPVVVPFGYAREKRSMLDSVMRAAAGSAKRKDWSELFYTDSFNNILDKNVKDAYEIPLEMARLAPSASNKQPWRILRKAGIYHFYICHTPSYNRMYSYDIQKIDMGIAMLHFEATAREAGLPGGWSISDPGLDTPQHHEYIVSWIPK